jgi:hypothetical protein
MKCSFDEKLNLNCLNILDGWISIDKCYYELID